MEAASLPQNATAMRLGELLVRNGQATQEHVDQALELQPVLRKRLGEIMVEKRWTSSRAVAEALYGPRSAIWDEAENRLHVQKALLALLLGKA